jgi:hypothetical protein
MIGKIVIGPRRQQLLIHYGLARRQGLWALLIIAGFANPLCKDRPRRLVYAGFANPLWACLPSRIVHNFIGFHPAPTWDFLQIAVMHV